MSENTMVYTYPLQFLPLERNFPIVCAVLALDSWNYCSGRHGQTAQHSQDCLISLKQLNHVHNIKIKKIRCCNLMTTLSGTRWHTSSFSIKPCQTNTQRKMLGWLAFLSRAIVPSCLVLILHRQLGNYLLSSEESYSQTFTSLYVCQCLALTNKAPTH